MLVQKKVLKITIAAEMHFFEPEIVKTIADNGYKVSNLISDREGIYLFVLNSKPDFLFLYGEFGVEIIQQIKSDFSLQTRCVLVLSSTDRASLISCLYSLSDSFLHINSSDEEYVQCLEHLKSGKRFISPIIINKLFHAPTFDYQKMINQLGQKERDVFRYIGCSYTVKQIANLLFISPFTVETHRSNIIKKLGLKNAKELRQLTAKLVHNYGF